MLHVIEIPEGGYDRNKFAAFCQRFNCKLLKQKRGDAVLRIETDNPINFFWLGCNLNFFYETSISISAASEIFK